MGANRAGNWLVIGHAVCLEQLWPRKAALRRGSGGELVRALAFQSPHPRATAKLYKGGRATFRGGVATLPSSARAHQKDIHGDKELKDNLLVARRAPAARGGERRQIQPQL